MKVTLSAKAIHRRLEGGAPGSCQSTEAPDPFERSPGGLGPGGSTIAPRPHQMPMAASGQFADCPQELPTDSPTPHATVRRQEPPL
jgi:hypothetical protein